MCGAFTVYYYLVQQQQQPPAKMNTYSSEEESDVEMFIIPKWETSDESEAEAQGDDLRTTEELVSEDEELDEALAPGFNNANAEESPLTQETIFQPLIDAAESHEKGHQYGHFFNQKDSPFIRKDGKVEGFWNEEQWNVHGLELERDFRVFGSELSGSPNHPAAYISE